METKSVGDVTVALMEPRLDSITSGAAEAGLKKLVEEKTRKILCDFSQTTYVSSAGLRVLHITASRLKQAGGQIVVCALNPYVHEVFETAGFTRIFTICDSEASGLAAFK
ncbi:MAG: hypothetical protein QG656_1947 [Candidatus Hydrogenedentes bacterium]|nr:hypothetical protein [Candidatus Hydrogenedentota bacterium]